MQGLGLAPERAARCALLFAETTRDGVYTHGLNRFPRFVASIANGSVDVNAEPTNTAGMGALERWDGRRGVGNLNASASMQRAIDLAKQYGIGGVALGNTSLVADDIAAGRLARPFELSVKVAPTFAYYLVVPHDKRGHPPVASFRDWLLGQLEKEPAVLAW